MCTIKSLPVAFTICCDSSPSGATLDKLVWASSLGLWVVASGLAAGGVDLSTFPKKDFTINIHSYIYGSPFDLPPVAEGTTGPAELEAFWADSHGTVNEIICMEIRLRAKISKQMKYLSKGGAIQSFCCYRDGPRCRWGDQSWKWSQDEEEDHYDLQTCKGTQL